MFVSFLLSVRSANLIFLSLIISTEWGSIYTEKRRKNPPKYVSSSLTLDPQNPPFFHHPQPQDLLDRKPAYKVVKKVSVKRDNNKEEFKVLDPENLFEEKIKK